MLTRGYGERAWNWVLQRAGATDEEFISMDAYDDDLTYRLIRAASEMASMPADDMWLAFGQYWIQYSAREGYGELLRLGGDSTEEFIVNLDSLLARVALTFPALKPPSFKVTKLAPGCFQVHYCSTRSGLAPFVVGLLRGLGKRFQDDVDVTPADASVEGFTTFRVTIDSLALAT